MNKGKWGKVGIFQVKDAFPGSYVRFIEDGSPIPSSGWDNPHSDQIAWYIKDSADGTYTTKMEKL